MWSLIQIAINNRFYMSTMKVKGQLYEHKYERLISQSLFDKVQDIMHKRNKAPVQLAGKQILFRRLITCKKCDGTITGDIKKQKYVYYSCHNSKRICTKKWIKEEVIVQEVLQYFKLIRLTDEQINEIVNHIQDYEIAEHTSIKNTQRILNEKLNLTQERISKLIDMHVDGKIDVETYHAKLEEYKKDRQNLLLEIKSYSSDNKAELVAAKEILEISQEARELFESSKLNEKQQILKLFCSNLTLNDGKIDVELRMPFNTMAIMYDQPLWRS